MSLISEPADGEKVESALQRLGVPELNPPKYLRSGFYQTIVGALWPQRSAMIPRTKEKTIVLDEAGNSTIVLINRPLTWKPGHRVALLAHGLAGDCFSPYITRLAKQLFDEGVLTVRMNHRNCGPAFGLSKKVYHSGVHEDFYALFSWIAKTYKRSPITAIGFSLSANTLLRAVSDRSDHDSLKNLDSLIAVSPPVDLEGTSEKLSRIPGSIFASAILIKLQKELRTLYKKFSRENALVFPRRMSIKQFDEIMCPEIGFKDRSEYYEKCSSLLHLEKIRIPTLIIGSHDDPMVDLSGLTSAKKSDCVDIVMSDFGGHVGFIETPTTQRWSDKLILKWLNSHFTN